MTVINSPFTRPLIDIDNYASRLHRVDPKCREDIPVTPEEAFALQERWLADKHLTSQNCFKVDDINILGHRIRIL